MDYWVGEYLADYSPLTPGEIAAPLPEVDELFLRGRPTASSNDDRTADRTGTEVA